MSIRSNRRILLVTLRAACWLYAMSALASRASCVRNAEIKCGSLSWNRISDPVPERKRRHFPANAVNDLVTQSRRTFRKLRHVRPPGQKTLQNWAAAISLKMSLHNCFNCNERY
jgi:hypothetical protein